MRRHRRGLRFVGGVVATMLLFDFAGGFHFGLMLKGDYLAAAVAAAVVMEGLAGLGGSLIGGSMFSAVLGLVLLPGVNASIARVFVALRHEAPLPNTLNPDYLHYIAFIYGASLKFYKLFLPAIVGALIGQLILALRRRQKFTPMNPPGD